MRQRIRPHLTYANVMATLAVFLVLGGGTALASYVISSNSQIGPGTISGHKPPTGKHANVIAGSINGQDIADRSGIDTCQSPLKKFGPICAESDGATRNWSSAVAYCTDLGLRLPSFTEGIALAKKYDVPGVNNTGSAEYFWTDDQVNQAGTDEAEVVNEDGTPARYVQYSSLIKTVCVTDPSA